MSVAASTGETPLSRSLHVEKQDSTIDDHFKSTFPQEFVDTFENLGIVFSRLPSIRVKEREDEYDSVAVIPAELRKPLTRHSNGTGVSIHVDNQTGPIWHVPPRTDTRGMNEKTKKGHPVIGPVGKKCSAVFSVYKNRDRWQGGVNVENQDYGDLFYDFSQYTFEKWDEASSIIKGTHPKYRLASY